MNHTPNYSNLDHNASRTTRYAGLIGKDDLSRPISIVGAGALGATIARELAIMGFDDLTIYDHDKVEPVNLGPQGFRFSSLGMPKVAAVAMDIRELNPECKVKAIPSKFKSDTSIGDAYAVFSCVDSLPTRRTLYRAFDRSSAALFVDGRLDVYDFERYAKAKGDSFDYLSTIGEESSVNTPCTERMTRQTTITAAAFCIQTLWDMILHDEVFDNAVLFNLMTLDSHRIADAELMKA
jgi:hypothetical protein